MTKASIEQSLHKVTNGSEWITKSKLKRWYGTGSAKLEKFVEGLDYRAIGNRIEFFVPDVADQVMKERFKNYG